MAYAWYIVWVHHWYAADPNRGQDLIDKWLRDNLTTTEWTSTDLEQSAAAVKDIEVRLATIKQSNDCEDPSRPHFPGEDFP
jgi:hypothetical protein